ncbi:MAG: hypothetical protein JXN64_13090 [Spirochaetes bacterium]|nr:hypothetical protein [Spirochaetota bacterium]
MKGHTNIKVILLSLLFLILAVFNKVYAADAMLGAKVWYPYWRPYLIDMGEQFAAEEGWQYIKGGSGMLYGPIASVTANKFALSISYLYGNLYSRYEADFTANNKRIHYSGSAKTRRHDVDSAVSYILNDSFRVFAGFKFQPYTMYTEKSGAQWDLSPSPPADGRYLIGKIKFKHINYAPAIGLGYSYIINPYIAVGANLSVLYFWGNVKVSMNTIYYNNNDWTTPVSHTAEDFTLNVAGYGLNVEPSFLIVAGNDLFVQIGFRYQSVWIDGESEGLSSDSKINDMQDYLYGIFISCLFRI